MNHYLRYVTIPRFCELSGYTKEAVKSKRRDGVWLEGSVWIKAPDGRILIDLEGYEAWAVTGVVPIRTLSGERSPSLPSGSRRASSGSASPAPIA